MSDFLQTINETMGLQRLGDLKNELYTLLGLIVVLMPLLITVIVVRYTFLRCCCGGGGARKKDTFKAGGAKSLGEASAFRTVAIDGNIGVGKSTLCTELRRLYEPRVFVHRERISALMLKELYANPMSNAFWFQMVMMVQRKYGASWFQRQVSPAGMVHINDRSVLGDFCFATWNYVLGNFSYDLLQVYHEQVGGSDFVQVARNNFFKDYDAWLYLWDRPTRCKKRVDHNNDRIEGADSGALQLDYYDGVDLIHFNCLLALLQDSELAALTHVRLWDQYSNSTSEAQRIMNIVDGRNDSGAKSTLAVSGPLRNIGPLNGSEHRQLKSVAGHKLVLHDWQGKVVDNDSTESDVIVHLFPLSESKSDLSLQAKQSKTETQRLQRLERVGMRPFLSQYIEAFMHCLVDVSRSSTENSTVQICLYET